MYMVYLCAIFYLIWAINAQIIRPGRVHEITNGRDTSGHHVYDLSTSEDANINIYCDDFLVPADQDPCGILKVIFFDGESNSELCGAQKSPVFTSKGSKARIEFKYKNKFYFTCYGRSSALFEPKEIQLNIVDGTFLFDSKGQKTHFLDASWIFTSPETRISLQCSINTRVEIENDKKVCKQDLITVDNGEEIKSYCGIDNIVLISKNKIKIHVQFGKGGMPNFSCRSQSITGEDPEEINNVQMKESSENAGEGKGNKTTTCSCGRRNHKGIHRIYNGNGTKEGEFPWMVSIRNYRKVQTCGGSLLTKYHALTAAHCVTDSKTRQKGKYNKIYVFVGAYHKSKAATHGKTKGYEPKEIYVPDEWWNNEKNYDIALILLKEQVEFSEFVGPICLTNKYPIIGYPPVKALGWGRTEKGNPDYLQSTKLIIKSKNDCVGTHMLCTYNAKSSICNGDSGSPLAYLDTETNLYTLIGVASYVTIPHCLSGSAYSNVTYHYNYLQNIIQTTDAKICEKM